MNTFNKYWEQLKAISIMQEVVLKHPLYIDNRRTEELSTGDHPVMARLLSVGDFGILLHAYSRLTSPNIGFDSKCDLNKSITERFKRKAQNLDIQFVF